MDRYIPGTHILWVEFRCHHCGGLPPDFYDRNEKISGYYRALFSVYEQIRKGYGRPLPVSRGWSCDVHQLFIYLTKLYEKYMTINPELILRIVQDPTMTPVSTHLFGALDLAPKPRDMERMDRDEAREAVKKECLKIVEKAKKAKPRPRIGGSYGAHVHIDLGYMIMPRYSAKLRPGAEW